ncbi:Peroxisomal membrane 22 kDa (Mpv17/PMP22) family protein [Euphorbia peplus]|nr:Peroxisomal membrane 22 kDa (Mpv17/PMP22) family protein [Euphorbia peplus]
MVPNSISLTLKSSILYRLFTSSSRPISNFTQKSHLSLNPVQITAFKASSFPLNSNPRVFLKDLGFSKLGLQLNSDRLCTSAVSGGGSGGAAGGSGNGNYGGGGGGGGDSGGENWSFLSWYLDLLAKYPVMTKALTSALLTCVGDLICQLVIDRVPSLDLKRTSIISFLGLVLVGPTLHFWYLSLSKMVTMPGTSGAFLRLLIDQFMFSPMFIGLFLSTLVTLEGKPELVVPKLQQEWFSAVLANWQLWIPLQFLNFRFVPQQFQVLAANAIALVWNVILSFKAHKEVITK